MRILKRLQPINDYLERKKPPVLFLHGIAMVLCIGYIDYATGPEISFFIFYFVPIVFVTAYAGLPLGMALSLAAAVAWLLADYYSGTTYSAEGIRYWNMAVRFVSFAMIAGLQHLHGRQYYLARTDFLTKVANSQHFYEIAEKEISRSKRYGLPMTLAYIDLDDFKQVNDQYGHMTGNRLLRIVAAVLKAHVREADTVARLGGDEFAVMLPQTGEPSGKAVFRKLHALLSEVMEANGWTVTFSMGVITFYTCPDTVAEMISAVDRSMYAVKNGGKNAVRFEVVG